MNPQKLTAVILDMDGVITQTARTHAEAWKRMFDGFLEEQAPSEGPFDRDHDYRKYVDGKPRYEGVQSFLEARGIELAWGDENDTPDRDTVCGLGNRKNDIFRKLLQQEGVEVYEDTVEQVREWKQNGIRVAVISSSRNCKAVLQAAGVIPLFDVIVDGTDLSQTGLQGKPEPDMFLHAAKQLDASPEETMVIEDAIAGIRAGRSGGFISVVGVARNGSGEDLRESGADRVVTDLRQLGSHGSGGHESGSQQSRSQQSGSAGSAGSARKETEDTASSALDRSEEIAERIREQQLALFLDYDGTLTPIVRRPEDATLSDGMRSLLREISGYCTVAIVSGRDRRDAEKMVQVDNLIYAGSHGFDIRGPDGLQMEQEDASRALPELDQAEQRLREQVDAIPNARVERKKFAIAVHYREVEDEDDVSRIENTVRDVVAERSGLRQRGGKKIHEIQPDIPWDKGRAIAWLTKQLGLDHSDAFVIYIGDDVTDEDAFRFLRERGDGLGIRVAESPSNTDASCCLRDPGEVQQFLHSLLEELRKKAMS